MTEIIHRNAITPHRVHALAQLVAKLRTPKREILLDLLQPSVLELDQSVSKEIIAVSKTCGLIIENDADEYQLGDIVTPASIASVDGVNGFRQIMRALLLNKTNQYDENYRFNLVTAWFAAQDAWVLDVRLEDLVVRYHSDLFFDQDVRGLNDEKARPWQNWAQFLGFGWNVKIDGQSRLVPDAFGRIQPRLSELLPNVGVQTECQIFIERLGDICPELDGGTLFEQAWAASHPGQRRGSDISLMVSNALRGLEAKGYVTLIRQPDSSENWSLPQMTGAPLNTITHIVLTGTTL